MNEEEVTSNNQRILELCDPTRFIRVKHVKYGSAQLKPAAPR